MNKRFLGKNDLILLLSMIALGVLLLLLVRLKSTDGTMVVVTIDGSEYGRYDLSEDQSFVIEVDAGYNTLVIENGECFLEDADCPDKLCVKQGRISKAGQSIICLPHRVVVSVVGDLTEFDAIAQ
ncbi:MAG: NusG domain II-containing protein [Butyrivibrio sp.]|nr:NusG domain II-containing protein [Butyrivibrio sp.]